MKRPSLRHPEPEVTDDDLLLVAEVAGREGWDDLARPPQAQGAPRSLAEAAAVDRYARAAVRRTRSPKAARTRARVVSAALSVAVLGFCWWVSPTRTGIALLAVGVLALLAMGRGRRRRNRVA
mgnify:CR=1 FL=1